MSNDFNRRDFMKYAALSAAGAGLGASGVGATHVLGANQKIRVGVIGTGMEGRGVMAAFLTQPDVEIVAVCDVYQPNLDKALSDIGGKARGYKDFREVLDRKDIDAVVIATPDHWHALLMILACQAGKDVYVEKPTANTIEESKRMVEAARKYSRVVQVGTEWRSNIHFQKSVQLIQEGLIGKVSFVRMWNYLNLFPQGYGSPEDSEPPAELDWDMWLGPAHKVPFNWNRFGVNSPLGTVPWSTFRYFWDYAGGFMTDWGVHFINVVQWAMKVEGPNAVVASGGKWYLQDNTETPDTLQTTFEYPGFLATYENRMCNQNSNYGEHGNVGDWDVLRNWGMEFDGTNGTLVLDETGIQVNPEKWRLGQKLVDRTPAMEMKGFDETYVEHVRNFLDCVKSRERPVSDIEIGHRATSTCHLGNIAYRTKSRLVWDVANQKLLQGGPEAEKLLTVEYRDPWKLRV
jgi:predicted dehydrogenase